ncbi:MAG: hypothetical protein RLZZ179_1358 [Verrucomicrobiota bacterium]|jgi:hypothetical protein
MRVSSIVAICCFLASHFVVGAELPRYEVSKVADLYPLNSPVERAGRLTNDGSVFSGNAVEGQLFAFTGLGGSPRLDIPAIPNAVGQGNTGNGLNFNETRQIVQSVYNNVFETNSTSHEPFLYTPGAGWSSLGKPAGQNAIVTTINEVGQVLAAGLNSDNDETSAWLYSQGAGWINLGNLGHSSGFARGAELNDVGVVVGRSVDVNGNTVPFFYTDGAGMEAITDEGTAIFGEATAVNNAGLVTGSANGRAFAFDVSTMELTWITPDGTGLRAYDINDAGSIIGATRMGGSIFGIPSDTAFYWDAENGLTGIDNLIGDAVNDWFITDAADINDDGWILGTGFQRSDRTFHQVLLRPVPEPSSMLLAGVGCFWFMSRHRARERTVN